MIARLWGINIREWWWRERKMGGVGHHWPISSVFWMTPIMRNSLSLFTKLCVKNIHENERKSQF
jgi:hypothetical protein